MTNNSSFASQVKQILAEEIERSTTSAVARVLASASQALGGSVAATSPVVSPPAPPAPVAPPVASPRKSRPRPAAKPVAASPAKRPATKKPAARAYGAKRSPEEFNKIRTRLLAHVIANPGQRVEQITKATGLTTRAVNLPFKKLVAEGLVRTEAEARDRVHRDREGDLVTSTEKGMGNASGDPGFSEDVLADLRRRVDDKKALQPIEVLALKRANVKCFLALGALGEAQRGG